MGLFKKKDYTPYRHIAMALVPPAAFAAVPNSPPPRPLPKNRKPVIASPIIPALLGVTATVRAVGLGNAGIDMQRLRIKYQAFTKGKSKRFDQSEALFATIQPPAVRELPQEPTYAVPHKTRPKERASSASPQRTRVKEPVSETRLKDVVGASGVGPRRTRVKEAVPEMYGKNPEEKRKRRTKRTRSESPHMASPTHSPVHFEEASPTRSPVHFEEEDLEERMRLREEQTRQMIFSLMRENIDGASSRNNANLAKEVAELLKGQSLVGAEGVILKQQIQELVDENATLKETVERLNVELSRFQGHYGGHPNLKDSEAPLFNIPRPKWLTDVKFLSPLFASYDNQLDIKDDVINRHELQFEELSIQMEEVLKENEILRQATEQTRTSPFVSQQRWTNLKEQRELMVEEIQVQLEQLELMERKVKQMHVTHVAEVAKLSKRLAFTDAEYQEAEKERVAYKEKFSELSQKHERLVLESEKKIPPEDFAHALKQCQSDIEDLKDQHFQEMKEVMVKVKESQKEKTKALQLQGEVEALKEKQTSLRQVIEDLRSDLNDSEERELECQLHLANAVKVAEQASSERATYAAVAEKEQLASDHAKRRTMREQWEMGRMEESVKQYKLQLASHNKDATDRIRDVEESHVGQLMQYERKMAHLQKLLAQKQQALDEMATDKREVENRLETVWQAANMENKMLMESLCRSNIHVR